ncbi:MAG: phosphoenolpyruvate carboxylase [Alphaproteobacteria bacterium GM202ARS2]|nr:phosphoenolpyruvate carboxylase [Alphaproteobacteria bacterium GM202ARS2]
MSQVLHPIDSFLATDSSAPDNLKQAAALYKTLCSLYRSSQKKHGHDVLGNTLLNFSATLWQRLDKQTYSLDAIESLVDYLKVLSLGVRADASRRYLQEPVPKNNDQCLQAILDKRCPTFDQLRALVETNTFGMVFTAHPTFGLDKDTLIRLSTLATCCDPQQEKRLYQQLSQNPPKHPEAIDLDQEHEMVQRALTHTQQALQRLYGIIIKHGSTLDPARAHTLRPKIITLYSWVGYDIDGRSDISWLNSFKKRLLDQKSQMLHYQRQCQDISKAAPQSLTSLKTLDTTLATISANKQKDIDQLPPEHTATTQKEADAFAKASRFFESTQDQRTTDPHALIQLANATLEEARTKKAPTKTIHALQVLTSTIEHFGLSLAHVHMRINASQLYNAMTGLIDLEGSFEDPSRKMTYSRQFDRLLADVKPAKIHFGSLLTETMSARSLFMLMSQMTSYIDSHQPIRFLIAECESAFPPLIALYFAKQFGIDKHIDISPLLETEKALNRAPALIQELIQNKHYRAYLKQRGRLCIQTGYSDAGRHLGQMACALAIERTHAATAEIVYNSGLKNVSVLFFDTHGESCGRGAHPLSLSNRLNYLSSPYARAQMKNKHIPFTREVSFQGGDGYALFMHPDTAYATTTRIVEHLLTDAESPDKDPFYNRPDEASEITHTIKNFNTHIMKSDDYAQLLTLFGHKLTYASGSRPHQRQYEGGDNPNERKQVREWRAIPHNSTLHQLGFLATVIGGVGKVIKNEPNTIANLLKNSPRFQNLFGLTERGFHLSDPDTFQAYIELYNPTFWSACALKAAPAQVPMLLRVADSVAQQNLYHPLQRLFYTFHRDYSELACWATRNAPTKTTASSTSHSHQLLPVCHALRLALLQMLLTYTASIPKFAPQTRGSHANVTQMLVRLNVEPALDALEAIFPAKPLSWAPGVFGVRAEYRGEHFRGYLSYHTQIFQPMRRIHTLIKDISIAISNVIGSYG